MKILSTKWFKKWSAKAKLKNKDLLEAINNLESGLSTANLGLKERGVESVLVSEQLLCIRKMIKQFFYTVSGRMKGIISTRVN